MTSHPAVAHVGIIGYGGFGRFLHQSWEALPSVRVVAVADPVVPLPAGCSAYRDAHDLLADPDVAFVSICTPPATHADLAVAALEAGKHVLVEKPLATSLAGADRIVEAAERTGGRVGVNYVLRYTPLVEWVVEGAQSGAFGALRHATVENVAQDEALPADHWFWDWQQSGGILVEHAVHFIDLVQQCVGRDPTGVRGTAQRRADGRVDRMAFEVRYGDEALVHQYHAFTRPQAFEHTRIHLGFEALDLDLDGWVPLKGTARALATPGVLDQLAALPGWHSSREQEGVVTGAFGIAAPKEAVYRKGVQAALLDLVGQVSEPQRRPRVTAADARASLAIALEASRGG